MLEAPYVEGSKWMYLKCWGTRGPYKLLLTITYDVVNVVIDGCAEGTKIYIVSYNKGLKWIF